MTTQKITILKGLPASGKTTWALEQVAKSGGKTKRVNKDDLRAMLDAGEWSKKNEKHVLRVRDEIILTSLNAGHNIIVDDTNFAPSHRQAISSLVNDWTEDYVLERIESDGTIPERPVVTIEEKFFDVPLKECIERNSKRDNPVPVKVIKGMYYKYLHSHPEYRRQDTSLPRAIICDIDGTIALMCDRGPFEWKKVANDKVNWPVVEVVSGFWKSGAEIILVSGRDGSSRQETEQWLKDKGITDFFQHKELLMRPAGDFRKDVEIKRELFQEYIEDKYHVDAVFDDRNQTVQGWRDLGLLCLQVAPGDF